MFYPFSFLPISPRLAIGAAWIFNISKRPCSFGSGISAIKWKLYLIVPGDTYIWYFMYLFSCRVDLVAAKQDRACQADWWPWLSSLCRACRSRPFGWAAPWAFVGFLGRLRCLPKSVDHLCWMTVDKWKLETENILKTQYLIEMKIKTILKNIILRQHISICQ